jgi:hypothetical protein
MEVHGDECLSRTQVFSGSEDLKREGERLKTIHFPVGLAHQKEVLSW